MPLEDLDSATLLEAHDWTFPVPIAYGPGRLKELGALCAKAGMSRPLIVTDRGSRDLPFVTAAAEVLRADGLAAGLHAEISPNPRDDEVAAGREAFRCGGFDGIVALGGGSGMDGAKAICLTAANELDLWDFDFDRPPPDMRGEAPFPPLICVPTTAGTGAETEGTGVITAIERTMKLCVWHPELKPAAALLDPELTLGLPPDMTAWTGCDALVHAVEAYCVPAFHPLCDGAALEALRLIGRWLPTAAAEPDDLAARGGMLVGSCLAGVSFLKGLGLVHAISHMVGAAYDSHHGLTNAVVLPAVLRYNAPAIAAKVPPMAEALGLSERSFDGFYGGICRLLDDLEIPVALSEMGVPADCAPGVAQKARLDPAAATNPRPATAPAIQAIVEEALRAGR